MQYILFAALVYENVSTESALREKILKPAVY